MNSVKGYRYKTIEKDHVLAAKIPDVAEAYRQGIATNAIVKRFDLGNTYNLYRILATSGEKYRKEDGKAIQAREVSKSTRSRHTYTHADDVFLVSQYIAASKALEKQDTDKLCMQFLMKFFPAKTKPGVVHGRLRRLGYPLAVWKDAVKQGSIKIPGPAGWKYMNSESNVKNSRRRARYREPFPQGLADHAPTLPAEPVSLDGGMVPINSFSDALRTLRALGFTKIGR